MKVNRKELVAALEAVMPGLASKEVVEQSTAFAFRDGRVYAYNGEIAVSCPCPKGLAGAAQAAELYKLIARLADDEIDVETTDNELLVKGKRSKAGIALQVVVALPDTGGAEKAWLELPAEFAAAVKFVLFSAGGDLTRPALTGVHLDGARVETCDNFRLTRYAFTGRDKARAVKGDLLLPAMACAELVKYEPTHYAVDDHWAHFTNAVGTEFSCRTIADKFPDLQPFVDRKWEHEVEFHEDTAAILDRAMVFLADKNVRPMVMVKVASGRMVIAARGSAGWFEEVVRVTATPAAFEFAIDPQALKDMLPLLRDCELSDDGAVLKFEGENFIHCCATTVAEE